MATDSLPWEAPLLTVFERDEPLRGYTLSISDIRSLLKRLSDLSEESHKRELQSVRERTDLSDQDKTNIEALLRRAHTLWTSFHGPHGEHFFLDTNAEVPEARLPKQITRILTGNINPYSSVLNREPSEGFQVVIDFSRPPFLDWANPVSAPTSNESNVIAKGNQLWTGAVIQCVEDQLESCRNRRAFLHRPFAYDIGLLTAAIPFAFLAIKRLSSAVSAFAGESTALSTAIFVYIFLVVLWLYRILFSYARWALPVMEMDTEKSKRSIHKWILGAIGASLVSEIIHSALVLFGS